MNRLREHTKPPDIALMDDRGEVFAEIWLSDGDVELAAPDRLTEAAAAFWEHVAQLAAHQRRRRRTDPHPEVYPG